MTHRGRFKGFRSHFVGPPALVDGVCTPQDCSSLVQLASPIARLAVTQVINPPLWNWIIDFSIISRIFLRVVG